MATLSVYGAELSVTKQKAIEDAKKMQALVAEKCSKNGIETPQYNLTELIGKGSFGRVYKGVNRQNPSQIVAVKIIDIEESDLAAPTLTNTMADLVKEIGALKRLAEGGAKNINIILDAFNIGHAMWMITEYCAGGSVSTLMKPNMPGGLQEKWIIPILREVAEAVFWVHKEGIVHRDIKCANVLVTEAGAVQLCDFGVAGFVENRTDKRTTFIGTLNWMAPEMFDRDAKYATEVDIWAFGSMAFEVASGIPPNVAQGIVTPTRMGSWLKQHTPRLEGDQYSPELKNLIGYCLEHDPTKRPVIKRVQEHPYLKGTEDQFPMSSLVQLVRAYRLWESQGGSRKSLFGLGGAQGPSYGSEDDFSVGDDEWNFSGTAVFDHDVLDTDSQAMYDVYGSNIFSEETAKPQKPKNRRRMPPHLKSAPQQKAPIEKVFDPNTTSNYDDYSRDYYHREIPLEMPDPPQMSDLPLRDTSSDSTVRESLIDLDASLHGSDLSRFVDMGTLKAHTTIEFNEDNDFNKPPLSDPADLNNNRRTQDWKFPSMAPLSANPEMSRFAFNEVTAGPNRSPLLHHHQHHQTEPATIPSQPFSNELAVPRPPENRASVGSLIDLDEGLVDIPRPSTANSDAASMSGSEFGGANPFEFERHAFLYAPQPTISNREPSIYVSDDGEFSRGLAATPSDMTDLDMGGSLDMGAGLGMDISGNVRGNTQRRMHSYSLDSNSPYQFPGPGPTSSSNGNGAGSVSGYASDTDYASLESSLQLPAHQDKYTAPPPDTHDGPAGANSNNISGEDRIGRKNLSEDISIPNGMAMTAATTATTNTLPPPPLPTQPPIDVMLGQAGQEKVKASLSQSIEEFRVGLMHASQRMSDLYHAQRGVVIEPGVGGGGGGAHSQSASRGS